MAKNLNVRFPDEKSLPTALNRTSMFHSVDGRPLYKDSQGNTHDPIKDLRDTQAINIADISALETRADNVDSFIEDSDYKAVLFANDIITVTKSSDTSVIKVYLGDELNATTFISMSSDGGTTVKPLLSTKGLNVTNLTPGYMEVVEKVDSFEIVELNAPIQSIKHTQSTDNKALPLESLYGPITDVEIAGMTLINLVDNSGFSKGLENIYGYTSTNQIVGNNLVNTGDGGSPYPQIVFSSEGKTISAGDEIFLYAKCRLLGDYEGSLASMSILARPEGGNAREIIIYSPIKNQWYEIYGSKIMAESGNLEVIPYHMYADSVSANGMSMEIDGEMGVFAINMTALGLSDYTSEEMANLVRMGTFDGFNNVKNPVIEVANNDNTEKSTLYVRATLNRVPNGVSDSIEGQTLKKRIMEYDLKDTDITLLSAGVNIDYLDIPYSKLPSIPKAQLSNIADGSVLFEGFYSEIPDVATMDAVGNDYKFVTDTSKFILTVPKGRFSSLADARSTLAGIKLLYELSEVESVDLLETDRMKGSLYSYKSANMSIGSTYRQFHTSKYITITLDREVEDILEIYYYENGIKIIVPSNRYTFDGLKTITNLPLTNTIYHVVATLSEYIPCTINCYVPVNMSDQLKHVITHSEYQAKTIDSIEMELEYTKRGLMELENKVNDEEYTSHSQQSKISSFPVGGIDGPITNPTISGMTLYNLIFGGDFSTGYGTYWTPVNAQFTASDNTLAVAGDGTSIHPAIYTVNRGNTPTIGDRIFTYSRARITTDYDGNMTLSALAKITGVDIEVPVVNAVKDRWYEFYGSFEAPLSGPLEYIIYHQYETTAIASGKIMEVDGKAGVFAINMTMLGIADYTDQQMLDLIRGGHFDGLKSTLNPELKTLGKNLFDKTKVTLDQTIEVGTGNTSALVNNFVSDYIEVKPNNSYVSTYGDIFMYDEYKTFLGKLTQGSATHSRCEYLRLTAQMTLLDNTQLENSSISSSYEPYNESTMNLDITLRRLPDGVSDLISGRNAMIKIGEVNKTTGTVLNVANIPTAKSGGSFIGVQNDGVLISGVMDGSVTLTVDSTIYYELAKPIILDVVKRGLVNGSIYSYDKGSLNMRSVYNKPHTALASSITLGRKITKLDEVYYYSGTEKIHVDISTLTLTDDITISGLPVATATYYVKGQLAYSIYPKVNMSIPTNRASQISGIIDDNENKTKQIETINEQLAMLILLNS